MSEGPWERLHLEKEETCSVSLWRMRVEGGWLYKDETWGPGGRTSVALCFVPLDPPQ